MIMSDQNVDLKQSQGGGNVDIADLVNPFPGLRPFGVEESHLFFGREGQSDEALVKLQENNFVAILGASGSGKSSFVYCGLIPTLHGGLMTDAGSNWRVVVCRPGGGPIDNLAEALLLGDKDYQNLSEEDKLIKKTIIGTVLRSSSLGLVEVLKQLKTDDSQNVLVLVDQFEELFRFSKLEDQSSDQNEAAAFVNLLLEASSQRESPIYVSLTMRSDFIGECAKYPELTQMINDSHYLIPQMTRDQKRMIIEGPVAVGGGKISPRLTQQLLNDLGDNPDQLPILQHALMRTWSFWVDHRKEDEPMDLNHYTSIGTLKEALSMHANEAYDLLSKREKEICEVMFKSLTEKGAENQGIRRPTKVSTLAAIAGVTEDEVERVVNRFREPGRSLLMPPHGVRLESDTVVDISHESLMRIWDRLKIWLDEEARAADMYLKLSDAATKFQEGRVGLWKMPDLQLAINWKEENNPTFVWGSRYNEAFERSMVFLDTSIKAYETEQANKILLQKRKVQFVRTFAIVAGAVAMVCIFLVVYAQIQTGYAEEALLEAQKQKEAADLSAEEAVRQATIAKQNEAEALRQKEIADNEKREADIARDAAVRAQAVANEQRAEAEYQKELADEATVLAKENEQEALYQEAEAVKQKERAEEEKDRAERLRYQAIAQSMAVKAQGVQTDPQLKALVAKQGYDFHMRYKEEGKEFNGDIYAGAYYGLQELVRQSVKKENPFFGELEINSQADSSINQFHGHKPKNVGGKEVAVRSVSFSKDGTRMFSAGGDGRLLGWDVATRSFTQIYKSESVDRVVNVSPDDRWLALGTNRDEVDLFDLNNPQAEPTRIQSHKGAIYDLVFLPDNSGFISVGADREILKTDINTYEVVEIALVASRVQSLAISPDGNTLAAGATRGEVYLFDLNASAGAEIQRNIYRRNQATRPVIDLSFSPDGQFLAIGGYDQVNNDQGYVVIWDMENTKQYGPDLTGFLSRVNHIEFSPDGKLVAAASHDQSARMWDMDPDNIFDLPSAFDDHTDWVWDLAFNPAGDGLMTASADGLIRFFPTKPDGMVDQMCGYIERNMSDTEWRQFVAEVSDIAWKPTCFGKPKPIPDED